MGKKWFWGCFVVVLLGDTLGCFQLSAEPWSFSQLETEESCWKKKLETQRCCENSFARISKRKWNRIWMFQLSWDFCIQRNSKVWIVMCLSMSMPFLRHALLKLFHLRNWISDQPNISQWIYWKTWHEIWETESRPGRAMNDDPSSFPPLLSWEQPPSCESPSVLARQVFGSLLAMIKHHWTFWNHHNLRNKWLKRPKMVKPESKSHVPIRQYSQPSRPESQEIPHQSTKKHQKHPKTKAKHKKKNANSLQPQNPAQTLK